MRRPIPVKVGELVRIYLINIVEFDLINTFHLHAHFFDYYDTGTTLQPTLRTVDTIMQAQGQRGILEFRPRYPGRYMFHAHVSEFAELGWMGLFNAVNEAGFWRGAGRCRSGRSAWDQSVANGSTRERNRRRAKMTTQTPVEAEPKGISGAAWVLALVPLILLGLVLTYLVVTGGGLTELAGPPVEQVSIQRITLPEPGIIRVEVVNDGPQEVTIPQVQVDDAYFMFKAESVDHHSRV